MYDQPTELELLILDRLSKPKPGSISEMPEVKQLDDEARGMLFSRLYAFNWIQKHEHPSGLKGMTRTILSSEGIKILERHRNPPPKDYLHILTVWFRSKWWSIPVFCFFVLLPAVWKIAELIHSLYTLISNRQ